MEQKFDFEVLMKLRRKKRKRTWVRVLSVLTCIVVFCTTYMLILPAITKETNVFCGIEAHEHSEDCYEKVLLCEGHVHTEECYESRLELICTDDGHIHTEECGPVAETILSCDLEEGPGHTHTEACEPVTETVLSCGQEESEDHTHAESCYSTRTVMSCQMEESAGHTHEDACYTTVVTYSCGLEENPSAHVHTESCYAEVQGQICPLNTEPGHEHTDACYEQKLICELPEHIHSLPCYANPSADLEYAQQWEATLPELTGTYAENVLAVARSQLGYTESALNYIVDENDNTKGYTRYGAWYGIPYGDWCAMFASFCLHYAEVDYPYDAYCPTWVNELNEQSLYKTPSDYVPKAGDIIFFDWEQDGIVDHVGLVEKLEDINVTTIEGNNGNCVARSTYELFDKRIAGYGVLTQLQREPEGSNEDEIQDAPYLDKDSTNAWVELVGDSKQSVTTVPQEEVAQIPAEEAGMSRMRSVGGATTFGLARTTMRAARAAGAPLDLTPYINAVAMYDSDGNPIPSGAVVTEGDLIEFKIEYTITGQQLGIMNGETVEQIANTLTYDLPEIFQIVRDDSGNIRNSSGQVVGSYVIDSESGKITMTFTEDYVEQNAKGIQIHGYISFFSTVTKITEEDGEHQDYKFTDKITLGVVIEEESESTGDLRIEKQKVSVSGEEILYEIKVTSEEGTNGPITVTDQMSAGLTLENIESIRKGSTTVNNPQTSVASDRKSFTVTLPEMKAGESYTIHYRCAADVDLLGADMTVRNTATVTGKDSDNKELKDHVTVDHTFDVLKKTGELNEDGSITWTITINQAKADISGWTLKDIMRIGNEQIPYTGPVTIRGSSGNIVANNVSLPYKFPDGSTDTYTITYTTTHAFGDGDTIYNSAILSDDDTDINVLTGVVVGTPFTKTGEAGEVIQDENGTYLLPIIWTVTIDTTKAPISGGLYFIDEFGGYLSDDMYMTYDQLMEALANFEAKVEPVSGEELEGLSAWVYQPGPDTSNEIYGFLDLRNNVNGCQSKKFDRFAITLGDKGIPEGYVLTFSYETYGLFPNNIVSTTTFKNRFNLIGQYEVEGRVDYIEGTINATKYGIKYYNPETQGDQYWFWSEIDGGGEGSVTQLDYNKLKDSYLAWAIKLSAPSTFAAQDTITLYEDLPEGVTVKDIRLVFQDNVPTANLTLKDVELGKIYKWEFPLYTAEQYVEWNHQNGKMVSIDVKVTEDGDLEMTFPGEVLETMSQYAAIQNIEESYGYLSIFTQINDDFGWTEKEGESFVYVNNFENRFTIKNEKDAVIDVGSQSQQITKDERDGMIKKTASTEEDNIITYSVVLNAYEKDLIQNSGTLAVHDELTYQSTSAQPLRLRLVPGSVKLYEIRMKSDGSYEKLGEVTANYQYNENSYVQYGITHWSHTIDLNVPDSTSLLLEYSYKASGNRDVKHNVSNTCTISGVGQGNLEGDTKVEIEVKDATAQADITGVMLYKVDANSDGIFLENAKFNIYIWNEAQGKYILVHHPNNGDAIFTTDANGMIVLDASTMDEEQFAYNTAYYIVEIESPTGYYLGPEPYYFYIKNDDTEKYPSSIPENFTGRALTSGDIIYRQNVSEFTEITVEKYWKDYGGKTVTVTGEEVSSVTLELWQMLQGDPGSAKKFGTYTMTPDENGNWSLTIKDLPKATKNADGTRGTNYLYYIKEVGVGGYALESVENNSGINFGTIKLVNKELEGYELPETGGTGTRLYTTAGLLLVLTSAACLLYKFRKRRREDANSS